MLLICFCYSYKRGELGISSAHKRDENKLGGIPKWKHRPEKKKNKIKKQTKKEEKKETTAMGKERNYQKGKVSFIPKKWGYANGVLSNFFIETFFQNTQTLHQISSFEKGGGQRPEDYLTRHK